MAGTVQVFVDLAGSDGLPHVFLGITDGSGAISYYGYGPKKTAPIGEGTVFDTLIPPSVDRQNQVAGHMDQVAWASQKYIVSDTQIASMLNKVGDWSVPSTYVLMGHNCGNFVSEVLAAGSVNYPMAGLTDHPVSFIPWSDKPLFFLDSNGNPATGGTLNPKAINPKEFEGTPAHDYTPSGGAGSSPSNPVTSVQIQSDANGNITQTATFADGSTSEDHYSADGGGTDSSYDAGTGLHGYSSIDATGNWTDYDTTYGANSSYDQTWTKKDGSHGETIQSVTGSTSTSQVNADGSSTLTTVDASTGVHGYKTTDAQGNWMDYETTYGANGSYDQNWTKKDGSHGETIQAVNGSTSQSQVNPDGSSTLTTVDAATGVHGYKATDAQGNWTDYETTYGANSSYDQTWSKKDGSHGETIQSVNGSTSTSQINPDGSSTLTTVDAATGVQGYKATDTSGNWTDYETTYGANSSYDQTWTKKDGSHGETIQAVNGSTSTSVVNPDGSSALTTVDAATGVHGYKTTDAQGNWTDYETTYGANSSYDQTWTKKDGSHGETIQAVNGSTSTSQINPDGSSTLTTVDAATGVHGYKATDAQGNWTDYETTYGANSSYDQTWAKKDGSHGETTQSINGSTSTSVVNPDGSSTLTTVDASTGVHGYKTTDAQGNWTDYETTYGANSSYDQTWTKKDGSHGETIQAVNGSTSQSQVNADGSSTLTTVDAATGVHGYKTTDASGNWTDYDTTYGANSSYDQTWSKKDGSHGETTQSINGSTSTSVVNPDGSSTLTTVDAVTGVHGYKAADAQGNWIDYDTTYGASGSYDQTWTKSDGSHGATSLASDGSHSDTTYRADGSWSSNEYDADGSYVLTSQTADGSYEQNTFDAASKLNFDERYLISADGSWSDTWTQSDGAYGSSSYNATTQVTEENTWYDELNYSHTEKKPYFTGTEEVSTIVQNGEIQTGDAKDWSGSGYYYNERQTQLDGRNLEYWYTRGTTADVVSGSGVMLNRLYRADGSYQETERDYSDGIITQYKFDSGKPDAYTETTSNDWNHYDTGNIHTVNYISSSNFLEKIAIDIGENSFHYYHDPSGAYSLSIWTGTQNHYFEERSAGGQGDWSRDTGGVHDSGVFQSSGGPISLSASTYEWARNYLEAAEDQIGSHYVEITTPGINWGP